MRILASIEHPNIVAYKEAFTYQDKYLCIVMEYANDGDLYQKIGHCQKTKSYMDEATVWQIFISIVRGLQQLHVMNIFHRDLKSANVFLYNNNPSDEMDVFDTQNEKIHEMAKLGDLNVSKVAKEGMLYTQTGTPYYASPEVWKDLPYDSKSDIWSLGCVVYEICALVPPFRAENMDGLYKRVLKGHFSRVPKMYSDELNHVIKKLLNVNAQGRPTCDQILSSQLIQKKMKKYGLLDKIPNSFKKKSGLGEGGNEKNSTATGGEEEESGDHNLPDLEEDGARKQHLMNTI